MLGETHRRPARRRTAAQGSPCTRRWRRRPRTAARPGVALREPDVEQGGHRQARHARRRQGVVAAHAAAGPDAVAPAAAVPPRRRAAGRVHAGQRRARRLGAQLAPRREVALRRRAHAVRPFAAALDGRRGAAGRQRRVVEAAAPPAIRSAGASRMKRPPSRSRRRRGPASSPASPAPRRACPRASASRRAPPARPGCPPARAAAAPPSAASHAAILSSTAFSLTPRVFHTCGSTNSRFDR